MEIFSNMYMIYMDYNGFFFMINKRFNFYYVLAYTVKIQLCYFNGINAIGFNKKVIYDE